MRGLLNTHGRIDSFVDALTLWRSMAISRSIDHRERCFVRAGRSFFHVSGEGHESSALLQAFIEPQDWLHLHYRDKALLVARGVEPIELFRASLCTATSHSIGRQMSAHLSSPRHRVLSMVGPVGNNALQAVGVALERHDRGEIVVCSVGDGTTQQGEFLEACAEISRHQLPVLVLIHDNALAISTRTAGRTFFDLNGCAASEFHGVPVVRANGRDPLACVPTFERAVRLVRLGQPQIIVMSVERLCDHTNADNESIYRSRQEVEVGRQQGDPLLAIQRDLLRMGYTQDELNQLQREIDADVERAAAQAVEESRTTCPMAVSLRTVGSVDIEHRGSGEPTLTMLQAMRGVLRHRLESDPRVSLLGQDIEDPKGDVFGLTSGLSTRFPGRVVNASLSESIIVGTSIGRALAGGRPVAFIQFADFLPLAFNQIFSELGSMAWRTDGAWRCPVIIMAPCGGYRPGLGPFHAQTLESVLAHVPDIQVVMPSDATDAAGLLNSAFASELPTVILYPKVFLNDRDRLAPTDVHQIVVPFGRARHLRRGDDLTLVTYGGTVVQATLAAEALARHDIQVDLIDLRSIQPWDRQAVLDSAARTRRLLVVHEDNLSCSVASEIVATVVERLPGTVTVRRVTRPDVYVPCNFAAQLATLPSFRSILDAACELLGVRVAWEPHALATSDMLVVEAQGSSPADQVVTVNAWHVEIGQEVTEGSLVAELEADKSVFDFVSPAAGRVAQLCAEVGKGVRVGSPLLRLTPQQSNRRDDRPVTREEPGRPVITGRPRLQRQGNPALAVVPIGRPAAVTGSRVVSNRELASRFQTRSADEIERLTGIRSRRWIEPGQDVLTLAVDASRQALAAAGLRVQDLSAIIAATTTPLAASPSLACMILRELAGGEDVAAMAHDVSAACTGYLYALASAFDHCRANPDATVLVVTSEVLSPLLDLDDFETAVIFGDAASATLVGRDASSCSLGQLQRPVLFARPDHRQVLQVDLPDRSSDAPRHRACIRMDGRPVFGLAVRSMISAIEAACTQASTRVEQLGLVVPHQANGRILDAVQTRLGLNLPVVRALAETGNTSSSSIPIALAFIDPIPEATTGLCAFGGGFTYGAALIHPHRLG